MPRFVPTPVLRCPAMVALLWAALGAVVPGPCARAMAVAEGHPPGSLLVVKGYAIGGENPLGAAHTGRVLGPYLGVPASAQLLRQAQLALERALHERGYTHYRVSVPVQTPGETLMLDVIPTVLSRVTVRTDADTDAAAVRRALPELQAGRSPNTRRLARQLAAAEAAGGRWAVALRPSSDRESLEAQVRVDDAHPWHAAVAWSNDGRPATGRDRLAIQAGHRDVGGWGHQWQLAYTTSSDQPGRVQEWHWMYSVPWRAVGGRWYVGQDGVHVPWASDPWRRDAGPAVAPVPGRWTRVGYVQHLATAPGRSARWSVELGDARLDAVDDEGRPQGGRERRSRPLTAAYRYTQHGTDGPPSEAPLDAYVELAAHVATGPAADLDAYRSERPGADTVHWQRLRVGAAWRGKGPGGWGWTLRAQGQYSPHALLAADAFALGGATSVRGAQERACLGDAGLAASLEAATPPAAGWRALAFVDAGRLWNRRAEAARPERDRLASVGVGVRYEHPSGARVVADYGRVITGSPSEAPQAPDRGDDKLHLSLSYTF